MRVRIFAGIILFFFVIVVFGLFYTQILKYDSYKELSENNRVRVVALRSPRGKIYDRKGELLVSSRIAFDVEAIHQEIDDEKKIVDALAAILGTDEDILYEKIAHSRRMPFAPVTIIEDIEKEKAVQIEELKTEMPGIIVTTRPVRNYVYKNIFAHVVGYLGEISGEELRKFKPYGYRIQDIVGKDGIEKAFNDYLRGVDGGIQVEVDNRGRQLKVLAVKEPRPGKDIYLTIDKDLQEFCRSLLGARRGAIITLDPSTGKVLSLVSSPDFDPNMFVRAGNSEKIRSLLNDSRAFPMLNRAIGGVYPAGSVFKIAVAAAALDSGRFSEGKHLSCSGSFALGNRVFHCWKETGHGAQNIAGAIKKSCNVFFYQLGLFLGPDIISEYAFKLGLGNSTGIELAGESRGLVPSPRWKKNKLKSPWFKGETANYAIGQGYLEVTPIQVLRLTAVFANGGKLVNPFIVDRIEDVKLRQSEPLDIRLKPRALETIKKAMRAVVNEPQGTGLYARSKEVVIAGKTGTAQNPGEKPHAWFAGFAPFKNPKICIVVFIEEGGKGGLEPARFAKEIIEKAKGLELLL